MVTYHESLTTNGKDTNIRKYTEMIRKHPVENTCKRIIQKKLKTAAKNWSGQRVLDDIRNIIKN